MLPRSPEQHFGQHIFDGDQSWTRFSPTALVEWLVRLSETQADNPAVENIDQFTDGVTFYRDRTKALKASLEFNRAITRFLETDSIPTQNIPDFLSRFDTYLSVLACLDGQTDSKVFSTLLNMSLPPGVRQMLDHYLTTALHPSADREASALNEVGISFRYLVLAEIILRNVASFGLWRAIEISKTSKTVAKNSPKPNRAFVGAVALDHFGNILAEAYRGESEISSQHAEDLLLQKLKQSHLLSQTAVIAVNLEPCNERSGRHEVDLGHREGCSKLLIKDGVPVVAYVIPDENPKRRGSGSRGLRDANVITLVSDNPLAQAIAYNLQDLQHFSQGESRLSADLLAQFEELNISQSAQN